MPLLEPPQHDDDLRLSLNCTGRVRSIVSLLLTFALWSNFFHWRTAITKAVDTFCEVFADVSMKLITWNSSHQLRASSWVISRSPAATSFWNVWKAKSNKAKIIVSNKKSFSAQTCETLQVSFEPCRFVHANKRLFTNDDAPCYQLQWMGNVRRQYRHIWGILRAIASALWNCSGRLSHMLVGKCRNHGKTVYAELNLTNKHEKHHKKLVFVMLMIHRLISIRVRLGERVKSWK